MTGLSCTRAPRRPTATRVLFCGGRSFLQYNMQQTDVRLALAILSSPSEVGRARRCFQRTAIHSLTDGSQTVAREASWLRVLGASGGQLLLRYVVSRPLTTHDELLSEARLHGDVWVSEVPEQPSTCVPKLVMALGRLASLNADFVAIGDDDAWFHPPRLMQDLSVLAQLHTSSRHVLYGYINFNVGWIRNVSREYGYGLYNVDAFRMWRQWQWQKTHRRERRTDDGPFPNAFGFGAVLSTSLAAHVSRSPAVKAYVDHLRTAGPRPKLPPGLRHRPLMCDPPTDASLGWILTHLHPLPNVTAVDLTYGSRYVLLHHAWNASQHAAVLGTRTAVLHKAGDWERHMRAALCISTAAGQRRDHAPILRCRGAHAPIGGCGHMGCQGPRTLIYPGRQCEEHPACATYYNATFADWTLCVVVGARRVPRLAQLDSRPWPVCKASERQVLAACAEGRLVGAGQKTQRRSSHKHTRGRIRL